MTPEEIAELFRVMEEDLFKSMARNMRRHEAWEEEEGFTWVQWQAEQINGLRAFREEIQDIVNATYNRATPEMERMLTDAYHYAGERAVVELRRNTRRNISQQFFGVTPKMRRMIDTVLNDVNQTRYAAINRMNSGYTNIIQQADILAQSGTMTVQQAVDRASAQFVGAGLNCVEYRNGHRVGIDSYVEMALRTSSRDAAAVAEGEKRNEWEEYLVISNVINTTCPHCMRWQGKVLVDDVYADGKPDGKHPLLSTAKADGFLHPNCRHKPRTYIPDVTRIPDQPEKAKTREQYEAEQKQRYYERNIRKYKRLRECSLDDENRAYYDRKVNEWSDALNEHLGDNPSLRGNAWRSSLRGNGTSINNVVNLPAIESPITPVVNTPKLPQNIQEAFDSFVDKWGDAKTEHSRVVGIDNGWYDASSKSKGYTKVDYAGTVEGSSTIHNHPIVSTFSPGDLKGTLLYGREYEAVVDRDNVYTLINLNPTKTPQDGVNPRWGFVDEYQRAIEQFEDESRARRRAFYDSISNLPREEQRRLALEWVDPGPSVYERMDEWLSQNAGRYDFVYMRNSRHETNVTLFTTADPMREILGSAYNSNPLEVARLEEELRTMGVEIKQDSHRDVMCYQPSASSGRPGQICISREASYSAWLHEVDHARADRASGWRGFRNFMNPEVAAEMESRAYDVEIEYAESLGYNDIADRLRILKQNRIEELLHDAL